MRRDDRRRRPARPGRDPTAPRRGRRGAGRAGDRRAPHQGTDHRGRGSDPDRAAERDARGGLLHRLAHRDGSPRHPVGVQGVSGALAGDRDAAGRWLRVRDRDTRASRGRRMGSRGDTGDGGGGGGAPQPVPPRAGRGRGGRLPGRQMLAALGARGLDGDAGSGPALHAGADAYPPP